MLSTSLDQEKLRKSMWTFYHSEGGRGAWTELGALSSLHPSGLARIAKGLQNATYETWMALHHAAPDKIPPPAGVDPQPQEEEARERKPIYRYPSAERLALIIEDLERSGEHHYIDGLCNAAENLLEIRTLRRRLAAVERQVK